MGTITKVKTANHDEWKALRSQYIGGSDAAAVVGLNAYSSQYSLWAEKTGRIPGFEGNLATEVGTFLEEFVAQRFAQETGKRVRKCNLSIFNSDYPWAIANIDREIVGEDAGLEIKTTSELNLKKFKGGEYPENYYAQMVHYLAITGKKRWYLAVLIGNKEFKWFVLERDEGEIAALMGAEKAFWNLVETDTQPVADGMEATDKAIRSIYPKSNGSSVDLYGYRAELARYLALAAQIKELEQQRDEAANIVKAFMAEAERGECDGFRVSWKSGTRQTFDSKRFAEENPGIDLSGYYKQSSTRTFRVTEQKGE
jgi:putative phage-type endonuclease